MEFLMGHLGWIFLATTFIVVSLMAAFFQKMACGICGEGLPTNKKAIVLAAITLLLTYLAWDFSGFGMVRFSKEAFRPEYREMIHNLTYPTWAQLPLNVKVDAVGYVPMVNKLPYIFALCVAGVCTVFGLTVTFRVGLVILVLQATMTLTAFAIANFLLGFTTHFLVSRFPKESAEVRDKILAYTRPVAGTHGHIPDNSASDRDVQGARIHRNLVKAAGKGPSNSEPSLPPTFKEGGSENSGKPEGSKAGQLFSLAYDNYLQMSEFSSGYLGRINQSFAPISGLLPDKIRHFLESGGWWLIIGLALAVILRWLAKVISRVRKTLRKKGTGRKIGGPTGTIKLAEMPPAPSSPGDNYLAIKGIPGRVRVFVMSPGGSEAGELNAGMAESVADHIKPGLGLILDNDFPLVKVWNRQYSSSGFPYHFFSKVVSPDKKGNLSNWSLLAGTVSLGKFKVHVGMAIEFMEKNNLGWLEIKPDQWMNVLEVRQSVRRNHSA